MANKKPVIHCTAICNDCNMEWTDYKTAREEARKHAKKTGHYVHGEEAILFRYGDKK